MTPIQPITALIVISAFGVVKNGSTTEPKKSKSLRDLGIKLIIKSWRVKYMELRPSKAMWEYMSRVNGKSFANQNPITGLQVACGLADRIAGYHISYSMKELLRDLDLLTKDDLPNKKGRKVIGHYLHEKYHRNIEGIKIINPFEEIKTQESEE